MPFKSEKYTLKGNKLPFIANIIFSIIYYNQ
jgi:hypothetical protein